MRLGVARAIVDGEFIDGDIEFDEGRVTAIGIAPAGADGIAVPGFVDIQVNGFAGIDFSDATPEDYSAVSLALTATGVVAYQPTLITLPEDQVIAALETLAAVPPDQSGASIIGMHLEGPFLSPERAGAHDPASMVDPDLALAERFLGAGPVTTMTLAPERPDAISLIELLISRGITVSCGHSNATAAEAHAAFDAGAVLVTHLFDAQRPFHHRDPGIVGAAMSRPDITASIIVDGFHLAPETVRIAMAAPARVALITDSIAAAGRGEGTYALGDRAVTVANGSARLDNGTLAGSVLTMDGAVRNLVDIGVDLPTAIEAATAVPAQAIGRADLGRLAVGAAADLVVLSDELAVQRTLTGGTEVFSQR